MPFVVTRNAKEVRTNGRSIVYIQPVAGAFTDIGFAAAVDAKATCVKEETTFGSLPAGYNITIEGQGKQAGAGNQFGFILDNAFPAGAKVVGLKDTALFPYAPVITADLDMKFDGKAGSNIKFMMELYGVDLVTAQNFITANT